MRYGSLLDDDTTVKQPRQHSTVVGRKRILDTIGILGLAAATVSVGVGKYQDNVAEEHMRTARVHMIAEIQEAQTYRPLMEVTVLETCHLVEDSTGNIYTLHITPTGQAKNLECALGEEHE